MPNKPEVSKIPEIVKANEFLVNEVKERNIKDIDLQNATGVAKTNYNSWRHGRLIYGFEKLSEIAEVLGIPMSIEFK